MKKELVRSSAYSLVAVALALAGCSAKQEDAVFGFPQIDPPASTHCPAAYAPIPLESAGAPSSWDAAVAAGTLRYSGAETYFQISESGKTIAQAHVVDAAGGSPNWKCSNAVPQSAGYSAEANLFVPITIARTAGDFDSEIHAYALEVFEGSPGMMLMTNTSGERTAGSPAELLAFQDVTNFRVYRLADGSFEVRLRREAAFSGTGVALTTAVVRYTATAAGAAR